MRYRLAAGASWPSGRADGCAGFGTRGKQVVDAGMRRHDRGLIGDNGGELI